MDFLAKEHQDRRGRFLQLTVAKDALFNEMAEKLKKKAVEVAKNAKKGEYDALLKQQQQQADLEKEYAGIAREMFPELQKRRQLVRDSRQILEDWEKKCKCIREHLADQQKGFSNYASWIGHLMDLADKHGAPAVNEAGKRIVEVITKKKLDEKTPQELVKWSRTLTEAIGKYEEHANTAMDAIMREEAPKEAFDEFPKHVTEYAAALKGIEEGIVKETDAKDNRQAQEHIKNAREYINNLRLLELKKIHEYGMPVAGAWAPWVEAVAKIYMLYGKGGERDAKELLNGALARAGTDVVMNTRGSMESGKSKITLKNLEDLAKNVSRTRKPGKSLRHEKDKILAEFELKSVNAGREEPKPTSPPLRYLKGGEIIEEETGIEAPPRQERPVDGITNEEAGVIDRHMRKWGEAEIKVEEGNVSPLEEQVNLVLKGELAPDEQKSLLKELKTKAGGSSKPEQSEAKRLLKSLTEKPKKKWFWGK